MKLFNGISKAAIGAFLYSLFVLQSAYGDDTEIFFAPVSSVDAIIPNVVFVIDTSGSMNSIATGTTDTRINIVKQVMDEVLTDISGVNVGLMRYNKGDTDGVNSAEGGPILYPATYIDQPADPFLSQLVQRNINDGSQTGAAGTVTLNAQNLPLGASVESVTAVRFDSLLVPQGAKITSATLVFTANGDSAGDSTLSISAELSDNAAALTTDAFSLSSRSAVSTLSKEWTPGNWTAGDTYSSPNIKDMVQSVVGQTGWCGSNSMVFFITGSGLRNAYSFEGGAANSDENNYYPAPKLHIKYENSLLTGANGCFASESRMRVSNRDHDWERERDGDIVTRSGDLDLYLGNNGNAYHGTGISFTNVNVPRNAIIKRAFITLVPYSDNNGSGEVIIKGVDSASPNPKNYSGIYSNANLSPTTWSLGNWVEDVPEESPDISSMVQTIVDKGGWTLGNTMSFYIEGISGRHRAISYDQDPSLAPQLTILYQGVYQPGVITKRENLKTAVANLPADGYTPISDVMAEAGLYFRGGPVTYGIDRDNQRVNRTSHPDSWEATGTLVTPAGCTEDNYSASNCKGEYISGAPNYISPITESCQTNHIVFLTDGEPTSHHSATNTAYNNWSGKTCSSSNYGSDCAKKIASYLYTEDQVSDARLLGKQSVKTHTIGFDIDFPLLKDMAEAGGGNYYTANNKDGLIAALNKLIGDIVNVNTSFVSSGVSINQFNRVTHNEELYFSLFSPASGVIWPGNVKRFRFADGRIRGADGNIAVDEKQSNFKEGSWSFWSARADGNDVKLGGVAEQLSTNRKVYSNISGNNLTNAANRVNKGNSAITEAMLGATSSNDREKILDWTQGIDVNEATVKPHNIIGDPLHSQPTLVVYNTGSVASPTLDTKVFVGTNHGFLHSFNSNDGTENWSFVPQQLLTLLSDLQKKSVIPHGYGIDGSISIHVDDKNGNSIVDIAEGEKAYLYVGMRRGGNTYFALDISEPNAPKFLFKIDPSTTGFSQLGQTWSKPALARMNIGGSNNRLVIIFGGGYDEGQDTEDTATQTDTAGNRVYIADALTGAHLWNSSQATQAPSPAGLISDMNAVPSTITAFDLDSDGLTDTLYAADTKAQIFRFDFDNAAQTARGGKIAHLQTAADAANNRRFYYQPDAALIRLVNDTFVSVSIGSGYRAHPLNETIQDYFYMIKDKGVLNGEFDMNVSMSNLVDITSLIGDSNSDGVTDAQQALNDNNANGWYLTLESNGEKVIERSITFNNVVLFTSYLPPGANSNFCNAAAGKSRLYQLRITDGNPYVDNNGDGIVDAVDRMIDLPISGIAPPPAIFIPPDGEAVICVGTACGFKTPQGPKGIMGIKWRKNN